MADVCLCAASCVPPAAVALQHRFGHTTHLLADVCLCAACCVPPAAVALQHRFGHTTHLLADAATHDDALDHQHAAPAATTAAATAAAGVAGGGRQFRAPRQHSTTPAGAAAGASAAAGGGYEDCTTKLLADSTSASACGIMGMLPQPRVGHLLSTIAGGAPVLHPTAGPFGRHPLHQQQQEEEGAEMDEQQEEEGQQQQQAGQRYGGPAASPYMSRQHEYQMSPELGPKASSYGLEDEDMIEDSQPDALTAAAGAAEEEEDAAGEPSPVEHWQQQQQQQRSSQQQQQQRAGRASLPAASPAGRSTRRSSRGAAAAAAASQSPELGLRPSPVAGAVAGAAAARGCSREGDEPTLELAAGVTAGMTGLPGQSLLEDATLEDFALPPEMMAAADERPITMPFSGKRGGGAGKR